jgi:hypothetical protein
VIKVKAICVAIFLILFCFDEAKCDNTESYYGLELSDGYSEVVIGSSKLNVAKQIDLEKILKLLDEAKICYSTINTSYSFWGDGKLSSATMIRSKQIDLIWLDELGIICRIDVKGKGIQTPMGLAVGMSAQKVYELFNQKGSLNVSRLFFSTREVYSFLGNTSETGFDLTFITEIDDNQVSSFTVQFSEASP